MSDMMLMGTTTRHNNILTEMYRYLANYFHDLLINKQISILLEQLSLCYYGEYKEIDSIELIDAANIKLDNSTINQLHVVQPDLMIFKDNKFLTNKEQTRYVGKPDLIVEVWSNINSDGHKLFKKTLYSTSEITEHWYIEQNSNEVECWFGDKQLPYQNLTNILKTQQSIEIDLRYLALD